MSPAVSAQPQTPASGNTTDAAEVADVLVIFGITGDLAKVMTFRSLYRLEKRGLLDCPVVGVASDDWTIEHLREHAKQCIEGTGESLEDEVFQRFAARPLLRKRRFHQCGHLRARERGGRRGSLTGLLSGDSTVPVRPRDQAAQGRPPDEERARGGREAVRP